MHYECPTLIPRLAWIDDETRNLWRNSLYRSVEKDPFASVSHDRSFYIGHSELVPPDLATSRNGDFSLGWFQMFDLSSRQARQFSPGPNGESAFSLYNAAQR
jgi:hypothetical protein